MKLTDEMVRRGMSVLRSYETVGEDGPWDLAQGFEDDYAHLSDADRERLVRDILEAATE